MPPAEQRIAQLRCLIANGEQLVEHLREWHLATHDGHQRYELGTRLHHATERLQEYRAALDHMLLPVGSLH